MFRKHTRRAAKAAFAISFGVALLIGLTACGGGGGKKTTSTSSATGPKPTITVGTKNFAEEFILGQLYGQALAAKGFKVTYKNNIGSSEVIDTAFKSGKINLYPEYTGVIALDLAKVKNPPKSATATYQAAKTFEQQSRGAALLKPTPFYDSDTFTMLTSTAKKDGLKTMSDLSKLKSFSYAALPECDQRITCILGMKTIYHLKNIKFVPLGNVSVYTLLDQGKATGGDGFSTDPLQLDPKYTALVDDKHIFGFQNVAPVVKQSLLTGANGALLENTLNAVSAKLTLPAMQAMNKAYYVNKATPKQIADGFLKANGLK
ncbi:MAG TPA: glycine betaine ABC transporter substrate-binding protein [Gaiellaceae bacterium]|nr:glycine betaine ABC transporter substrate-binding protein [Gaiellaceae bacterium]